MHGRRPNAEALAMVRRDPRMRRRRRVRSPWSAARSGEKFARRIRGDLSRLLDVVLLEGLGCAVDGVLLHVLAHVGVLDDGLALHPAVIASWLRRGPANGSGRRCDGAALFGACSATAVRVCSAAARPHGCREGALSRARRPFGRSRTAKQPTRVEQRGVVRCVSVRAPSAEKRQARGPRRRAPGTLLRTVAASFERCPSAQAPRGSRSSRWSSRKQLIMSAP